MVLNLCYHKFAPMFDFPVVRGRLSIQNGQDLFNFCNTYLQKQSRLLAQNI